MFVPPLQATKTRRSGPRIALLLIAAWTLAGPAGAGAQRPIDPALIEQARTWEFGQSREPLERIADQITAARAAGADRLAEAARQISALLADGVSRDGRDFACRQLALIGTDEQIPALAALLGDGATFEMALFALDRIPGAAADDALIAALSQTELGGPHQCALIHALARRKTAAAAPTLVALSTSDRRNVVEAAIQALGAIGGDGAEGAVLALLSDLPTGDVLSMAAAASLLLAEGHATGGAAPEAARIYQAILDTTVDANLRAAALRGLMVADPDGALERTLAAMADDEGALRRVAIDAIRALPGAEATGAFSDALAQRPHREQPALIEALADRRDPAALDAVSALCDSPDLAVRVAALRALGRMGDASTVERLAPWAVAESEDERQAARAGLRAIADPAADGALADMLATGEDALQVEILTALRDRQARDAAPAILQWAQADHTAIAVRLAALQALQTLANSETAPDLLDLATRNEPGQIAPAARRAYLEVARRNLSPEQRTEQLRRRLVALASANPERRGAVARLMGELGDAESLETLRQTFNNHDEDETVRLEALRALAQWPTAAPRDVLAETARTATAVNHRALALRGYVRAIGLSADLTTAERVARCAEAMDLAEGREEVFAVLAVLSETPSPEALELVLKALERDDTCNEAALAVCRLVLRGGARTGDGAMAALDRALERPLDDAVRAQIQLAREQADALQGYLLDWQVAGPYMQEGKTCMELFDIPFGPELADEAESVHWRPMPVGLVPDEPWNLDLLAALNGGHQRVAYLKTHLHRSVESVETLEMGSDDGIKVWLNGQEVFAHNVMRPLVPGQDQVEITLQPGRNTLMFKITQNDQGWGASARLTGGDTP